METTLEKTETKRQVGTAFAEAIKNNDRAALTNLLDESTEYDLENDMRVIIKGGKQEFIMWVMDKRNKQEISRYYFDTCTNCNCGAPVLILNDGFFPTDSREGGISFGRMERCGLMLNIHRDRIKNIGLCFSFLQTENISVLDVTSILIKKYMDEHKCDYDEAYIKTGCEKYAPIPEYRKKKSI
jgi:hypothetical protein